MRQIININENWSFTKSPDNIPSSVPGDWEKVSLPHSWNAVDGMDGGGDYFRGECCYVRSLSRSDLPAADRYYMEFRGTNSSAELFLNGRSAACHRGGYSTWRADITDFLADDNLIAVTVNNSPNREVYPQLADFTFYGGIYRDVNIICVSESHFDLDYWGGPGIKVTPEISGAECTAEIEVFLSNPRPGQTVRYTVLDRDGVAVSSAETADCAVSLPIPNVRLWHGRRDPYLYTAVAELISGGEVIDTVSARFGCRTFRIDPDKGFILNGEEHPLRGVCRHQDRWQKGNALSPADHLEDMDLICEVGANTLRLAHYQQDQYFYDLCDERGIVVWAEIPYIGKHMPTARENTLSQMKELIVQNYNHASIAVWGLSNEIGAKCTDEDLIENHRLLNDLCHRMDKTRLTTLAVVSMCSIDEPYLKIPDAVGYNLYFGWYGGTPDMTGPWLDVFHETNPDIPICCSEYGCEALNWHSSDPVQGDYTEEYQAYYHEELIKQLYTRKYLWATHVWNMFDFGADARNEGGENGLNHKGLVTVDRKYKKDSFYAYKAWLSDEPFVHLCGKRYTDRVEDVTRVTVYSNLPEVELFANGVSLGKKKAADHFFYFDVPNEGESQLLAVAGEYSDTSVIRKVEVFNEEYRFAEKGVILNWFDITAPKGYLSLNDKMSDVLRTPRGKELFTFLMCLVNKLLCGKKSPGFEINPELMSMMSGFTVLRLLTVMGPKMKAEFTKEELLELNSVLNTIKKAGAKE